MITENQKSSQPQKYVALDFDGVLFDTLFEVFTVCQLVAKRYQRYRKDVSFEEFSHFRRYLCDAWQFNRLYSSNEAPKDWENLKLQEKNSRDIEYASRFFAMREKIKDKIRVEDLAKPSDFFKEITPLVINHPLSFLILSTRPKSSIERVLDAHSWPKIRIYGQAEVSTYGSKYEVAKHLGYLEHNLNLMVIDDMHEHLVHFYNDGVAVLQADWGYDVPRPHKASNLDCVKRISRFLELTSSSAS